MSTPKVTILIPNYKTLQLTKLCLRLIRKHTISGLAEVIVIDNDSADSSLDYLRTLPWIKLIERSAIPGESPAAAHARALDLGLAQVKTPYVLSIHTDTLIKKSDWLSFLINQIEMNSNIGGVGSWKLENVSASKKLLQKIEAPIKTLLAKLRGKKLKDKEGEGSNYYYLRSHCALYRMDLLQKYNLRFDADNQVAGKAMHKALVEQAHDMIFIPSEKLIQYLDHINHATMVLNPGMMDRSRAVRKGIQRVKRALEEFNADAILKDSTLDI